MAHPFRGIALHTWTLDTTPLEDALGAAKQGGFDAVELRRVDFRRCFERGLSNAQVLDLVRAAGLPVSAVGPEYGWLFASGDERARLFSVFRETCENAVALECGLLMSALGPGSGSIDDAIASVREPAISRPSSGCGLRSSFSSSIRSSAASRSCAISSRAPGGRMSGCCSMPITCSAAAVTGVASRMFRPRRSFTSSTATCPTPRRAARRRPIVCRLARVWCDGASCSGCWRRRTTAAISATRLPIRGSGSDPRLRSPPRERQRPGRCSDRRFNAASLERASSQIRKVLRGLRPRGLDFRVGACK